MMKSKGSTILGRKEAGVERVLVEPAELAARVRDLASQVDSWYPAESPILIGVLNGAVVFMTELMQAMTVPVSIDFMAVSSYGSSTQSSGVVQILKDLSVSIEGRDVLVVEDIVDSGLTLQYLLDYLQRRNPKSLRVVALLRKVKSSALAVPVDLVGFEIPDEFVIGYGLDYAGLYRNLPYIGVLSPAAIMGN
jgi:hypoxanthine phosphoribosyltransferase